MTVNIYGDSLPQGRGIVEVHGRIVAISGYPQNLSRLWTLYVVLRFR